MVYAGSRRTGPCQNMESNRLEPDFDTRTSYIQPVVQQARWRDTRAVQGLAVNHKSFAGFKLVERRVCMDPIAPLANKLRSACCIYNKLCNSVVQWSFVLTDLYGRKEVTLTPYRAENLPRSPPVRRRIYIGPRDADGIRPTSIDDHRDVGLSTQIVYDQRNSCRTTAQNRIKSIDKLRFSHDRWQLGRITCSSNIAKS